MDKLTIKWNDKVNLIGGMKLIITKEDLIGMNCDPEHVDDWFAIRKAKKKPLTGTALKTMITEANKAGYTIAEAVHKCAEEGWQGFKAAYVANRQVSVVNNVVEPPVSDQKTKKQAVRTALRDIHNTDW